MKRCGLQAETRVCMGQKFVQTFTVPEPDIVNGELFTVIRKPEF